MFAFLLRRSIIAVFSILAICVIAFVIIQLPPGDFLSSYIAKLSAQGDITSLEEVQGLRKLYGLDQPSYVQFFKWVGNMLRGDLGMSFEANRPVRELIGERLVLTVLVALCSVLFTWSLAIPIGILSAVKQRSMFDYIFSFLGFIGLSVPHFMLALLLMYFSYSIFEISVGGLFSPEYVNAPWSWGLLWDLLKHIWIPALVLGAAATAAYIRIIRANLLDELRKPYVVTARAKGLSEWRLILKYPVRIAMNPFLSTVGFVLPTLISGGVIVSVVLSLPTLGPLLLRALLLQDMYLAGTIILMLGILTVIGTLISDILLLLVDPRIRMGRGARNE